MHIKKLTLYSFRSYLNESIELSPKVNIFVGDNGAGKTNILESIYSLASTKSYKNKDEDMILEGKDFFKISSEIEFENRIDTLLFIMSRQGKKVFKNNVEVKKISEFVGNLNVVLFSPEDLFLLKAGPGERRKLIDLSLMQISKKYVEDYQNFKKQLKLRNDYLKYLYPKLKDGESIEDEMLGILTLNFININKLIFEARENFLKRLEEYTKRSYKELSGTNDDISFVYETNFDSSMDFFKEKYQSDILNGSTQYGCHRDDVRFLRNGIDLESTASQGELRMLSLSIKIALSRMIKDMKREAPVVLLDDVLSELDINHQNRLLSMLDRSMQIIITTTDILKINQSSIKNAKLFKVEDKHAKEIQNGR